MIIGYFRIPKSIAMKLNKIISKGIACLLVIALFHSCKKKATTTTVVKKPYLK